MNRKNRNVHIYIIMHIYIIWDVILLNNFTNYDKQESHGTILTLNDADFASFNIKIEFQYHICRAICKVVW